jgi:protein-disulfide isomerase
MRPLAAAFAFVAALAASQAGALDLDAMTDAERDTFRAEVRAYLLDNPEVLQEAMAVLEERLTVARAEAEAEMVAANLDALHDDPASWVGGNPDGDITLVEFIDYRCGYCRRAYEEVEGMIADDGNIRFVVKEFPILGPESMVGAQLAIAILQAGGPEAYKQAHDALITWEGDLGPAAVAEIAASVGLDPDNIAAAMQGPAVNRVIADNHALAQRLQIGGTPTFVIDGEMVRGYMPRAGMEEIVAARRAERDDG